MEESGMAGFEVLGWFALWAPANTPSEEITRLNAAVNDSLKKPDVLKQLSAVGAQPMVGTPDQQARWQQAEETKWGGLIRELGIKL
jgi:tripartite-type tricarboxylate transporter receptor subunit TctC